MIKKYRDIYIVVFATFINLAILLLGDYKCPWRSSFNIYCAGCGATRMVYSLLELDFYQAFRYNPLMFIILVLFIIYCVYVLIAKLFNFNYFRLNVNYLWGLLLVVVIFTIVRNISCFDFLKPTRVS